MANITLGTGITTNGQFPVDGKVYFLTQSDAADLGDSDVLAYAYYERMRITIADDGTEWVWREEETDGESGLISEGFTYPDGLVSNGIDYSNRTFNFFEVTSETTAEPTSDGNFVRNADGSSYSWVEISSTDEITTLQSEVDTNTAKESAVFDSSLDGNLAMAEDVGNISSGTTINDLQDLTFTEYIELQNFPTVDAYILVSSSLSLSGINTSIVEVGTGYSFTASMSFDTGQIYNGDNTYAGPVSGDADYFQLTLPDGSVDYSNSSIVSNSDSHTTTIYSLTEGANTWTFSGTNEASTTSYTDNKGGTETVASIETAKADTTPSSVTLSKTARFPYIYGMSDTDYSTGGSAFYDEANLTHSLGSNSDKAISLTGTNSYVYFSYPASYGALSQILDSNGFDVTSSFTRYDVNVTSTGLTTNYTEAYYIYRTVSVTTISGQTYQFLK